MADIHILMGDGKQSWTVVFHYSIPDQDNAIGVSYRTALVNSGLGGTSQMEALETPGPGQIASAELTQIENGELYEYSAGMPTESGATTNAEMLAFIRAEYARLEAVVLAQLQKRLRYYGYTASKE